MEIDKKRLTIALTPEIKSSIDALKNTRKFRDKTYAETLRFVLSAGIKEVNKQRVNEAPSSGE